MRVVIGSCGALFGCQSDDDPGTEGPDCCTSRWLRGEAIRFGQQQIAKGLKADTAGV